jgi:glycosyltransferase involved in cell wall biosynthesis/O-antigen/teichoic acid export membrane protein
MNRARLLLISEIFHPEDHGGQGQQAFAVARSLRARGMRVDVVTRRNFASSSVREHIAGIDIVRLAPTGMLKGQGWSALWPTLQFLFGLFLYLLRTRRSFDVILLHGVKAILIPTVLAAKLLRKPCIVKSDAISEVEQPISVESLQQMRSGWLRRLVNGWSRLRLWLLRQVDAFVAISVEMERAASDRIGADRQLVRIPNGIEIERWRTPRAARERLREELGLPKGFIVTYSGRLSLAKDLPSLLESWLRLAPRFPDAHLLIVGSGERSADNCEPQLREFVARHGLQHRVTFAGHVNNVADYLHASNLFVQCSPSEGFGLALVEAMASGLPCVSTAVGVAPELLAQSTGWLVPPSDPAAFEQALNQALERREEWGAMGVRAREEAHRFDLSGIAVRYDGLIEQVLHRRAGGGPRVSMARNASWLLGCRISADLLNFVLFLVIANVFGPSGMGLYAYGFALAGFMYAATTLGIDEYGIREFVRRDERDRQRLISSLLGAQIIVSVLAIFGLAVYLRVTGATPDVMRITVALTLYQLCAGFTNTLFVPSMAEQRMTGPALVMLGSRAVASLGALLLIFLAQADIASATIPFALGGIVMLVLSARSARSFGCRMRPNLSLAVAWDASRNLWSFAALDIVGQIFTRFGVIALTLSAGERAAGIYATGLKLAEVACMPLLFLGQAAYPVLSRAFASPIDFGALARRWLLWGAVLAILSACAMAALAPVLLVPILGEDYAGSEGRIAAMASFVLVQGLELVMGRLLLAADQSVARARWMAIGAVVCAIASAALVPYFGIVAAIVVTAVSYLLVDVLYLRDLHPHLSYRAIPQAAQHRAAKGVA